MANIKAQAEEHERRIRMEERASAAKRQEEAIRREKQAADDAIKAAIDAAIEANKERRDEAVAKNKRHRAPINPRIIASIVALVVDIDEETAKKIVVAVADGAIPGMRIDY